MRAVARTWLVVAVAHLALTFTACALLDPYKTAKTPEQIAGAILGDFDIYQKAALSIAKNDTVATNVRLSVIASARAAKQPMDDLDKALRLYSAVKAAVLAGAQTEDQLGTVAAQLDGWIKQAQPLLSDLKKWVGKVHR